MKTVTFHQLDTWFLKTIKENPDLFKGTLLEDLIDDDDNISPLSYYAQETENWDVINNDLFSFIQETSTFIINDQYPLPYVFTKINDFSNWVSRSYDQEHYPWETNAWESNAVQISGDDDVDYNSGYLDTIVEALTLYLK